MIYDYFAKKKLSLPVLSVIISNYLSLFLLKYNARICG
ncbi:hypothetical protein BSPLISOX_526 [uncultured Gammaproteobacteria bacterium]|nr:hypothetical protein BSPLISOX_526 [uncultured Gammaproteobacteria bacterium]